LQVQSPCFPFSLYHHFASLARTLQLSRAANAGHRPFIRLNKSWWALACLPFRYMFNAELGAVLLSLHGA
jgi:hypothetical protein